MVRAFSLIHSHEEPCMDEQENHIRAVSWHERTQHVSRAEPSAPGKIINKSSVVHFLYNPYTKINFLLCYLDQYESNLKGYSDLRLFR